MGSHISVSASDGSGQFLAYLAQPASSGKGPAIVLVQEIFGVNAFIREVADRYAQEGFVVLAPDLFWRQQAGVQLGYTPQDWQKAFEFYKGFDEDKGVQDIAATLAALRARPEVDGAGAAVLGFCLGGKLAYLAACRTDAQICVSYYGVGIERNLDEAKNIRGQLLLHLAELDQYCPAQARASIVGQLTGRPGIALHIYPGVDHAFARTGGEHFDSAAAQLAQQRSLAALRQALGPR